MDNAKRHRAASADNTTRSLDEVLERIARATEAIFETQTPLKTPEILHKMRASTTDRTPIESRSTRSSVKATVNSGRRLRAVSPPVKPQSPQAKPLHSSSKSMSPTRSTSHDVQKSLRSNKAPTSYDSVPLFTHSIDYRLAESLRSPITFTGDCTAAPVDTENTFSPRIPSQRHLMQSPAGKVDPLTIAESALDEAGHLLEDLVTAVTKLDTATQECRSAEDRQHTGTISGSFSKALAKHRSPISNLESVATMLGMRVLPEVEQFQASIRTLVAALQAERSTWNRKLSQVTTVIDEEKAELTSVWVNKWQTREAEWQKLVNSLQDQIALLQRASHERTSDEADELRKEATVINNMLRQEEQYKADVNHLITQLNIANDRIRTLEAASATQERPLDRPVTTSIVAAMQQDAAGASTPVDDRRLREQLSEAEATLLSFKKAAQDYQEENARLRTALQAQLEASNSSRRGDREIEFLHQEVLREHDSTLTAMRRCNEAEQRTEDVLKSHNGLQVEQMHCHERMDRAFRGIPGYESGWSLEEKVSWSVQHASANPQLQLSGSDVAVQHVLSHLSDDMLLKAGLRRVSELHKRETDAASRISALEREIESLRSELSIARHELEVPHTSMGGERSGIVALSRARAQERSVLLSDLKRIAAMLQRDPTDAQLSIITLRARAEACEADNARLQEEVLALQTDIARNRDFTTAEINQYKAALHQAENNLQAALRDVEAAEGAVMRAREETAQVKQLADAKYLEESADKAHLHATISDLQQEIVSLQSQIRAQTRTMASAVRDAELKLQSAVQEAREEAKAAARVEFERELQAAISSAVRDTDKRVRTEMEDTISSLQAQHKSEKALELTRAQRTWEDQTAQQIEKLKQTFEFAMMEAVQNARDEEQDIATAKLHAQQLNYDSQVSQMEAKIEEIKEMARQEIVRRREVYGKLLDLQGNIRVHVRVKPAALQMVQARAIEDKVFPVTPASTRPSSPAPAQDGAGALPEKVSGVLPFVEGAGAGQLIVRAPLGVSMGDWSTSSLTSNGGQGSNKRNTFEYEFDEVHGPMSTQEGIFEYVRPMVEHALDGYNVTIFAYGQTGSGKTYTMEGTEDHVGITKRTIKTLLNVGKTKGAERSHTSGGSRDSFMYKISMLEVYQEKVCDLLHGVGEVYEPPVADTFKSRKSALEMTAKEIATIGVGSLDDKWATKLRKPLDISGATAAENLPLRETPKGVEVVGLTKVSFTTVAEAMSVVGVGILNRSTGAHALNDRSSRSHMIIRLWIEGPGPSHVSGIVHSTINLVDLAGSERVLRTGASGDRLKEAQAINTSLSALGNVVYALKRGTPHVPFRDSKLTFLLRESMTGASKVLMLCCVSSEEKDIPETLCSLQFAQRCRATALGAASRNVLSLEDKLNPLSPSSPTAIRSELFDAQSTVSEKSQREDSVRKPVTAAQSSRRASSVNGSARMMTAQPTSVGGRIKSR